METEIQKKKPGPKPKARPDSENRAKRPRRHAVGGAGSGGKLNFNGLDHSKYHYRLVTDEGGRIDEIKEYGYEVDTSTSVSTSSVNSVKTGSSHQVTVDKTSGKRGVLMRQPIEFHEEDRALKAKAIDKKEESMYRQLKTEDGRYGEVDATSNLSRKTDD
jgi:hypothetical protein